MDNIWQKFSSLSIKWKLILIYLLSGVIPILAVGTFSIYNRYRSIVDYEQKEQYLYTSTIKKNMFSMSSLCYNISQILCYDKELKELLTTSYKSEEQVYSACRKTTLLDSYSSYYMEISEIHVYTVNPTMFDYGNFSVITEEVEMQNWYQKAIGSMGIPFWYAGGTGKNNAGLSLIRYMNIPETKSFAVIVISISENYLASWIGNIKYQYLVGLDTNSTVIASDAIDKGKQFPFDTSRKARISTPYYPKYHGNKVMAMDFAIYGTNTNSQFQVIVINDCFAAIRSTLWGFIPILSIAIFLPLFLIIIFSNKYSRRVMAVRDGMHKVAQGNLNIMETFEGQDELGELFRDIKVTIQCIKELQEKIYKEKMITKELENVQQQIQFELLASQINPHFLFNTLESIRMQAALDGNNDLTRIIMQLGKILRFSLENKKTVVPLVEELNYVESYFEIQRFRFKEKINCQIHIQPDLEVDHIFVLPLLIQPFVENSFSHGLSGCKMGGRIDVDVLIRETKLIFTIRDNGRGITEDSLYMLKRTMKDDTIPTGKYIGIYNVHKRIKMYYGEEYGVEISAIEGEGTTVIIRIPCTSE